MYYSVNNYFLLSTDRALGRIRSLQVTKNSDGGKTSSFSRPRNQNPPRHAKSPAPLQFMCSSHRRLNSDIKRERSTYCFTWSPSDKSEHLSDPCILSARSKNGSPTSFSEVRVTKLASSTMSDCWRASLFDCNDSDS